MDFNTDLIANLEVLVRYYMQQGDQWRTRAYTNAILVIRHLPYKITHISQVTKMPGIGIKTLAKINEFLTTGKIQKVEDLRPRVISRKNRDIATISGVWGIGEVKAKKLYDMGIETIDDLRENEHLLTKNQRIGLKYHEELQQKIPREYIDVFKTTVDTILSREFGVGTYQLEIAGSYRRGKPFSGDIDCLISSTEFGLQDVVSVLTHFGIITDKLGLKKQKFMGIAYLSGHHFRLDIEFLPPDEWGSGLLYFTGSQSFNIAIRSHAKKHGFTLNEHGLFQGGKRIPAYTEQDIMNYLGLAYVEPHNR